MSLSRALQESYASGDDEGVVVTALEIDHPGLSAAILLVQNTDSELGEPGDTLDLPLVSGGPRLPHLLCAFSLVAPGADDDGPTDGKIQIDAVSGKLDELLRQVVGYNESIRVTFRQYRVLPGQLGTVDGPDDDTYSGLELVSFELSAGTGDGTVAWPDGRQQNVPSGPDSFFDRDNYPGLFT